MKNKALFYGLIIGLTTSLIGSYLFIFAFTPYSFWGGLQLMNFEGKLGRTIAFGTFLNIGMYFALLKYKKEALAKGVLLAVILLSVFTLFI